MQEYDDLVQFRKDVNILYESIKILQIFVEETHEDIPNTIIEKSIEIIDEVYSCSENYRKLCPLVLKPEDCLNKRKRIVNFADIKENLDNIKTCFIFLKISVENDSNNISYQEICRLLKITLCFSEEIINLANRAKLKIYPAEIGKRKSSVKDLDFSKYEIANNNLVKIRPRPVPNF
mgnify:CR=1 FL=1